MKVPKNLRTVTPLSKLIALILFIALPFIGFALGMQYQASIDLNLVGYDEPMHIVAPQK